MTHQLFNSSERTACMRFIRHRCRSYRLLREKAMMLLHIFWFNGRLIDSTCHMPACYDNVKGYSCTCTEAAAVGDWLLSLCPCFVRCCNRFGLALCSSALDTCMFDRHGPHVRSRLCCLLVSNSGTVVINNVFDGGIKGTVLTILFLLCWWIVIFLRDVVSVLESLQDKRSWKPR